MINYWWVTRPKRRLNTVPDVLATFSDISLNMEWQGQRESHLSFEEMLEKAGLKRIGERRDQGGSGARTYKAWIMSLGLIFEQEKTRQIKLTLAGEAIMNGENPLEIIKNQVIKYQFPSSFSVGRNIDVNPRFKVHPFVFLLRLLSDSRINGLTQEEIAKIVAVEAEDDGIDCFEKVVQKILLFRTYGDACLDDDFTEKYAPSKEAGRIDKPFDHLLDLANTIINWIEYTQLARRDENRVLKLLETGRTEVEDILNNPPQLIDRPHDHEYFQRKYGVDLKHRKDTRNLLKTSTITAQTIAEQKIRQTFIGESITQPISRINRQVIDSIASKTGIEDVFVEETLFKYYPHGAIGAFMAEYFEMAFSGTKRATEFEQATANIFKDSFGFETKHVGPIGLTPDVLLISDCEGYSAIIDNKAYSKYSISNDHFNRMVTNYIQNMDHYYSGEKPLAFFSYIAGGFGSGINRQLKSIEEASGIKGSAMPVGVFIEMLKKNEAGGYSQKKIRDIFSVGRQISITDL